MKNVFHQKYGTVVVTVDVSDAVIKALNKEVIEKIIMRAKYKCFKNAGFFINDNILEELGRLKLKEVNEVK